MFSSCYLGLSKAETSVSDPSTSVVATMLDGFGSIWA